MNKDYTLVRYANSIHDNSMNPKLSSKFKSNFLLLIVTGTCVEAVLFLNKHQFLYEGILFHKTTDTVCWQSSPSKEHPLCQQKYVYGWLQLTEHNSLLKYGDYNAQEGENYVLFEF